MSKKKGTNNKKNAKAQEKVQNLEQNEVVEKDINKPNETKTSDNESTKVSKEAKKVDVAKADKKAKKDTKTKKHFFKDFKAELKKVIWPTSKQLANNTFAVIVVVLIIAVVVFVLDFAFENINANGINKIKQIVESQNVQTNSETNSQTNNSTNIEVVTNSENVEVQNNTNSENTNNTTSNTQN